MSFDNPVIYNLPQHVTACITDCIVSILRFFFIGILYRSSDVGYVLLKSYYSKVRDSHNHILCHKMIKHSTLGTVVGYWYLIYLRLSDKHKCSSTHSKFLLVLVLVL